MWNLTNSSIFNIQQGISKDEGYKTLDIGNFFVIAAHAATGAWEEEGRCPPEENPVVLVLRNACGLSGNVFIRVFMPNNHVEKI